MNTLKKIFAVTLCLILSATCLAGCHKKGEIAVTAGEYEFTSAYYSCALVFADSEARLLVQEELDEEDLKKEIEYYKHKIDKTDYTEWVKTKALDNIKTLANYKALCKEAGIELSEDDLKLAQSNIDYMWDSYGYSVLLQANGVSYDTFKQYYIDGYYTNKYFDYLYGEGGKEEIPADQLSKQLTEDYVLVNALNASFAEANVDQIKELREKFTEYETALRNGSRTFEEIYVEYNEIKPEEHKHEAPAEGELAPQDYHATVWGDENTEYAYEHFDAAKSLKVGEVKIITLEDEAGLILVVKKDIAADPYYLDNLNDSLRQDLRGDEFEENTKKLIKDVKCEVNNYAANQFKVKNIQYPVQ